MKNTCWIVCLLVLTITSVAQQVPSFENKVYRDEDGKLYLNKELPVYIYVATSDEEGAEKYLLQSEETAEYANPFYMDTEGYNTFRSPSAVDKETREVVYPLRDIIFEIYSDSKAPQTNIGYGNTTVYNKSGKKYLSGEASVILDASDATSGVENIYYSIDGQPYKTYSDTLTLTEEKEYNIKYFAVDHVGNAEEVKESIIEFDRSAPKTTLEIIGDKHENNISGRSKIQLSGNDDGIGIKRIRYSIDGQAERTYTSPILARYLSEGEHTITYYAVDNVNNTEKEQSYTFFVDKTPPTIIEELVGTSFMANGKEFTSGRTQLKLVTFDNKAGVKEAYYAVNGEDYQLYDKPFYLSMSSGNLAIKTYAVDNVNNKSASAEETSRADIPYIDLSGPELDYGFSGPVFHTSDTIFINEKTQISLKGSDREAGLNKIRFRIDDKKMEEYDQSFNIKKEDYYNVYYEGFDNVDNSNNKAFSVFVDNTGPSVSASFSITSKGKERIDGKSYDVYPSHLVVFLSATDAKVGVDRIYYSINDGPEKIYAGLISDLKPGTYTLTIRGVDKLGNDTTDEVRFAIVR